LLEGQEYYTRKMQNMKQNIAILIAMYRDLAMDHELIASSVKYQHCIHVQHNSI